MITDRKWTESWWTWERSLAKRYCWECWANFSHEALFEKWAMPSSSLGSFPRFRFRIDGTSMTVIISMPTSSIIHQKSTIISRDFLSNRYVRKLEDSCDVAEVSVIPECIVYLPPLIRDLSSVNIKSIYHWFEWCHLSLRIQRKKSSTNNCQMIAIFSLVSKPGLLTQRQIHCWREFGGNGAAEQTIRASYRQKIAQREGLIEMACFVQHLTVGQRQLLMPLLEFLCLSVGDSVHVPSGRSVFSDLRDAYLLSSELSEWRSRLAKLPWSGIRLSFMKKSLNQSYLKSVEFLSGHLRVLKLHRSGSAARDS